jgi:hypothetical protein
VLQVTYTTHIHYTLYTYTNTIHYTLYIIQSTLYTLHYTLYTLHSTLPLILYTNTIHYHYTLTLILHTIPYTLTLILHTIHCRLKEEVATLLGDLGRAEESVDELGERLRAAEEAKQNMADSWHFATSQLQVRVGVE